MFQTYYFDGLTELLKNKLTISSTQEKIKMLTLTLKSWFNTKKSSEFNKISKYLAKRARKLKSSKGVLADPVKRREMCPVMKQNKRF